MQTPITESKAINVDGVWMVPALQMQKLEDELQKAYDNIYHLNAEIRALKREAFRHVMD